MKKMLLNIFLILLMTMPSVCFSQGIDRDVDNDGVWDADKGGIDRDLDNDGVWDQ